MKSLLKQFGGKATKELVTQYAQSPNWKDGKFENLVETTMNINMRNIPSILYKQFFDRKGREPKQHLPVLPLYKQTFETDDTHLIWYGHSVGLLRINGKNILIDPMLGPDAAPIAPFASKRYSENTIHLIDDFPEIDLLLLTHDHYDHLDLASMQKLIPKVKQYFVALGSARHLIKWGVKPELISEFDWWDSQTSGDIQITFTPSRHFSGRGATDRAKSLWGGWALKTDKENIYWSGDGGYGDHFKEVGDKLGPFDFGVMECGQYNENWHAIHMYPEEAVQAAIDAGVQKAMPVHWAGFALAMHHWKDPIERFTKAAADVGLSIATPRLGQQFSYKEYVNAKWWEEFE
ncbi:MAG: MBL fold metallo-hydrolase [Cyclobacteriaceae bacterium]